MNISVKQVYDNLKMRGLEVEYVDMLNGATMLNFMYKHKLRFISGVSPDLTSATGRTMANNKLLSSYVAERLGVPVPATTEYDNIRGASRFLAKYKKIVVKPLDSSHGNGITTNVTTVEALLRAIKTAKEYSPVVILQEQVGGIDIRLLMIDFQLIVAAQRVPASVVGDGTHSVAELIDIENATNSERGYNYEKKLNKIDSDLAESFLGEKMQLIPDSGSSVSVVGTANIGTGGKAIECTDTVPAGMVNDAISMARTCGIFTCGVDFMYDSSAEKWYFIEMNSSPSFGLHLWPSVGRSVDVVSIFVEKLLSRYDEIT